MINQIMELADYNKARRVFRLSAVLAKLGFKLKTEGSLLGIFWHLLDPIFTFILLWAIFGDRLGRGIANYPLYLFIGIIIFSYFTRVTGESLKAMVDNRWVIRSVKFDYEALILASVLKNLFSFALEAGLLLIIALCLGQSIVGFIFLPLIIACFSLFIYGVSLFLSALYVYFSDLENIWNYFSRLLWFATPIFYQFGGQNRLRLLNLANPLFAFIDICRSLIAYGSVPSISSVIEAGIYVLLALAVGRSTFNMLKRKFPEKI